MSHTQLSTNIYTGNDFFSSFFLYIFFLFNSRFLWMDLCSLYLPLIKNYYNNYNFYTLLMMLYGRLMDVCIF